MAKANRRQVLKSAGIAFTALGPASFSATASSPSDTVELVTVKRGSEVAKKREAPRKWYRLEKRARNLKQKLFRIHDRDTVTRIGIENSDSGIQGWLEPKLTVQSKKPGKAQGVLSSEADGVSIDVQEWSEPEPVDCEDEPNSYSGAYNPIPAGVDFNIQNGGVFSTSGLVIYNDTRYMLTCTHGYPCNDVDGHETYQDSKKIGVVASAKKDYDVALVELTGSRTGFDYASYSDGVVDDPHSMKGYVTKDGLSTLRSNNETVHKRGVGAGAHQGTIGDYGSSVGACGCNCNNYYHEDGGVVAEIYTEGGDSGGIVYNKYYDDYYDRYLNAYIGFPSYKKVADCSQVTCVGGFKIRDLYPDILFGSGPTA